jgi:hypothetical protein
MSAPKLEQVKKAVFLKLALYNERVNVYIYMYVQSWSCQYSRSLISPVLMGAIWMRFVAYNDKSCFLQFYKSKNFGVYFIKIAESVAEIYSNLRYASSSDVTVTSHAT